MNMKNENLLILINNKYAIVRVSFEDVQSGLSY